MGGKMNKPANDAELVKMTDEGIAEYIELPADTIFVESMAYKPSFREGVAFVPVQRMVGTSKKSYIYEIAPGMTTAKLAFGPIAVDGGNDNVITTLSIFGCSLTNEGILYLACFNRNSVLKFDLNKIDMTSEEEKVVVAELEIPDLPSPNDICIDDDNNNVIYVAGGKDGLIFTNSAYGRVFKVTMDPATGEHTTEIFVKGLDVLAGIEVINNDIWIAQLYDIVKTTDQKDKKHGKKPKIVWEGDDKEGTVWLADNIDVFDGKLILSPAYSAVPKIQVNAIMKNNWAMSGALLYMQIASAIQGKEDLRNALEDPEVALSLSNTYVKYDDDGNPLPAEPLRIVFLSADGATAAHFEVDLKETRANHADYTIMDPKDPSKELGKRHFFNQSVTHAGHLKLTEDSEEGYVVCINFEQPRILLLKDAPFRKTLGEKGML